MLSEPGYIAEISSFWSAWQGSKNLSLSLLDWWDLGKARIKTLSIDYCRHRSVARHARSDLLSAEVARLKSFVDQGHVSALPGYKKALSDLRSSRWTRLMKRRFARMLGGSKRVNPHLHTFSVWRRRVKRRVLSLP